MPPFPPGMYHQTGGCAAAVVHREAARRFYGPLLGVVLQWHRQGQSLRDIAAELDAAGLPTRYGGPRWSATQVRRVLARAQAAERQASTSLPPRPEIAWASLTAAELLEHVRVLGYRLAVKDGQLTLAADENRPAGLVQVLKAHAAELRDLVTRPGPTASPLPAPAADRGPLVGCAIRQPTAGELERMALLLGGR